MTSDIMHHASWKAYSSISQCGLKRDRFVINFHKPFFWEENLEITSSPSKGDFNILSVYEFQLSRRERDGPLWVPSGSPLCSELAPSPNWGRGRRAEPKVEYYAVSLTHCRFDPDQILPKSLCRRCSFKLNHHLLFNLKSLS